MAEINRLCLAIGDEIRIELVEAVAALDDEAGFAEDGDMFGNQVGAFAERFVQGAFCDFEDDESRIAK